MSRPGSSGYSLTPAAREDLREIQAFLRKQSAAAAKTVIAGIREQIRKLAAAPGIGHLREDLSTEPLRFWSVWSYLIVYRVETERLEVVRVLHGSRDVESLLQESREEDG